MMAKFKRKINDSQRRAMIRRKMAVAAMLKSTPWAAMKFSGSGDRSEVKNIIIARAQAKKGRNPWKMRKRDIKRIYKMTEGLRRLLIAGHKAQLAPLLNKIGMLMVQIAKENIDSQRSMRPVNPEYEAKHPGKILKRTGQLYSSVRHVISKGGG